MAITGSGNGGIQLNNMVAFWSAGRIGTGSAETIKHGLGVTPTIVLVQNRIDSETHTLTSYNSTDIVLTAENLKVYDVLALVAR